MVILIETSSIFTLNDQSIDLLAINRNVFGTSSEIVGHLRILSVPYEKSRHSQDKNVTPMNHKKLAGIPSEQMFHRNNP